MNEAGRDLGAEIEKTMRDLEGLGRAWAAHGLRVGRAALETSATTLKSTAALLGRIAAQFEEARASRAWTEEAMGEDAQPEDGGAAVTPPSPESDEGGGTGDRSRPGPVA